MRHARPATDLTDPAPTWLETGLCIGVIAMLTGALIGPVFAPTQLETPILRLAWLPVYAIVMMLAAVRLDRLWRAWPGAIFLVLTLGLAFASKYWSIDYETTSRRIIAVAITGVFALYLATVFRGAHLPRLLMHATVVMAIGSLVMIFAFPTIGVHQYDNAGLWRGLWYEKNQMGAIMTIGAVGSAACLASPDPRKLWPLIALVLSATLVVATKSKTSLLCLMAGLGMVGGFWAMRRGGPAFAVVAIWTGVVVAAAGIWLWDTHSNAVLEALGKDPSLTGRTEIWAALMRRVAERPWTGYGYGAFWGITSTPAEWVRKETNWPVPSAHNGWIDLLVQLGWPGAVLVALMVATATVVTVLRSGGQGVREGWWGLGFLAGFIILSLSESILLTHQSLPWVLFLAVLTRALLPGADVLAARPARAYQSRPRIAAQYADGPVRPRTLLRPVR